MSQSTEKRQITWFFAFKTLFNGIGSKGMFGLKALILAGALYGPCIFYFMHLQTVERLSGAVPPTAPVIRATGYLVRKIERHGLKEVPYFDFVTDDKRIYKVTQEAAIRGSGKLAASSPPTRIYAEGFFLRNGSGSFWFTFVRLADGRVLVTPEQSMKQLDKQRHAIAGLIYIVLFFWVVSLFNIYQLKRKLSMEV